jgi:signal transduction histidine kinase
MRFRTKLLIISSLTVLGVVALVTGVVSVLTRQAFERTDEAQRNALLDQFRHELQAQSALVAARVEKCSSGEAALRIALEAARPQPDFSGFLNEARAQAEAQSLDFLDIVQSDGSIISSAHWPARFGYPNNWLLSPEDWEGGSAFLTRIPLADGAAAVALAAVRKTSARGKNIYLLGARRLDAGFVSALGRAPGMRVILWLSEHEVLEAGGPVAQPEKLLKLVRQVQATGSQAAGTVQWSRDRSGTEALFALPLAHRGNLLGVLILATSLAGQMALERSILSTGLVAGAAGILLGVLMGWWATERISRPVERLAAGVRAVSSGDWEARVPVSSQDEVGELARAFNRMTELLLEQRDRALQAERVAAWRELARRLAHELKNPLFPLQLTVENLQRAREQHPDQFEEVFQESTATLAGELANMKSIIGRFSDFARMPAPQVEPTDVREIVRDTLRLLDTQLRVRGITTVLDVAGSDDRMEADPELLGRALQNLVLNAMDAMPEGGTLRIRTEQRPDGTRIEVSDTGQGLSPEECARVFTPYYTTKKHGTGLGLAIVQSVVSDHQGRISVSSEPGRGTTFTIDLPGGRNA